MDSAPSANRSVRECKPKLDSERGKGDAFIGKAI